MEFVVKTMADDGRGKRGVDDVIVYIIRSLNFRGELLACLM